MRICTVAHLVALMLLLVAPVHAQDEANQEEAAQAGRTTAAGVRQEHVQRMMQDLEQKFVDLARTLEQTEPGQAKRLIEALQKSKEAGIETSMSQIARMLNDANFSTATAEQKKVVAELEALIAILLSEDDVLADEIERLERWKEQLDQLIQEELQQRRDSETAADPEKALSDVEEQIAAVEGLIKKQQQVIENTAQARKAGIQGLGKVADEQARVRAETENLAQKMSENRLPDRGGAAQDRPADPDQSASPDQQPGGEPDESDAQPGEASQARGASPGSESPAGSDQPSSGTPSSSSPSPGSPSSGTPSPSSPSASKEPGQQSLEKAAEHQAKAEQDLSAGKGKGAEEHEKQALAELEKALAELKGEQRRIVSLPPEAMEQMAKAQDSTAEKTAELSKEMQAAPASSGSSGESGEAGEGEAGGQPGQAQVQEAQQSMQQASGGLRKKDPKKAAEDQQKAVEELKKALEEIQERLAQLRKEMQIEKLAALEARFQEMLDRQKPVTASTQQLEELRVQKKFTRADRLKVSKFGDEERAIAELAKTALDIIVEDGTSVVFPSIVEQLHADLQGVGELLKQQRTDSYTQAQQREIELTLQELIDALQKLQEQLEGGAGQGGQGAEQNEPLLPNSAELKLLRASQLRINRRTKSFEEIRLQGELESVLKDEITKISVRQAEIAELTQEMVDRQ